MKQQRFWVVRHDHNDIFLAPPDSPHTWVGDELTAQRFDDEDAALDAIIRDHGGKGRAMLVSAPNEQLASAIAAVERHQSLKRQCVATQ